MVVVFSMQPMYFLPNRFSTVKSSVGRSKFYLELRLSVPVMDWQVLPVAS
jgi:hypothetical protein